MIETHKNNNGTITVTGCPIRGFDWTLIRKSGQGTYARIAGLSDSDPDEEIVVEEHDAPEDRTRWDDMEDWEAAEMARGLILAELYEKFWTWARVIHSSGKDDIRFPKKIREAYPAAIRYRRWRNKTTGETRATVEMEMCE